MLNGSQFSWTQDRAVKIGAKYGSQKDLIFVEMSVTCPSLVLRKQTFVISALQVCQFCFNSCETGLAGIRVGYGAFPLGIIEFLWRAKQPYNVSVSAEVAACAALKNPDYLEKVKVALVNEREKLFKLLRDVPFLTPYPSNSNFILCSVDNSSKGAKQLKADLSKEGVMVRHYDN